MIKYKIGKRKLSERALKPEILALSVLVTLAKSHLAASAKHQNHLKFKALEFFRIFKVADVG